MKKLAYLFVMVAGLTLAAVNLNAQDAKSSSTPVKKETTTGCCQSGTKTADAKCCKKGTTAACTKKDASAAKDKKGTCCKAKSAATASIAKSKEPAKQ